MTLNEAKKEGMNISDTEIKVIRMGYGWLTAGEHTDANLENLIQDAMKERKGKADR